MFGWIMFNALSPSGGFEFIKLMFVNFRIDMNNIVVIELISVLLIFELIDAHNAKKQVRDYSIDSRPSIPYKRIVILICCIILLGPGGQNSFIYTIF